MEGSGEGETRTEYSTSQPCVPSGLHSSTSASQASYSVSMVSVASRSYAALVIVLLHHPVSKFFFTPGMNREQTYVASGVGVNDPGASAAGCIGLVFGAEDEAEEYARVVRAAWTTGARMTVCGRAARRGWRVRVRRERDAERTMASCRMERWRQQGGRCTYNT